MAERQDTISRFGFLLAVLGRAAGLLYVAHVPYWSGERAAEVDLEPRSRTEEVDVALSPDTPPVCAAPNGTLASSALWPPRRCSISAWVSLTGSGTGRLAKG